MKQFQNWPLSKKAMSEALRHIKDSLNTVTHDLHEKLLNGKLSCDCSKDSHICFECLRAEAETLLSDTNFFNKLTDEELQQHSELFEHELDRHIAALVADYEEHK